MQSGLFIGTSGWSYPWKELFYPSGMKPADYLYYYTGQFNAVEINSSFYHFPQPKTVDKWLAAAPPGFCFAPKLHRDLTHTYRLTQTGPLLDDFVRRFMPMGRQLGPFLVQLPASLPFDAAVAEHFFGTLRDKYPDLHFALEARHASWLAEPALALLRENAITWVVADSGRRFPALEIATTELVYLRLHGAPQRYISAYSADALAHFATLVCNWQESGKQVWVFFNNTMYGHAVADARILRAALG